MTERSEKFFPDKETTSNTATEKKTWDGSKSEELLRLRVRCASDTMELKRSTIRIPQDAEDVAKMEEKDFAQYVISTIETSRLLVLEVLEKCKDSRVFVTEWEDETEIDRHNFDISAASTHVKERIKKIDTLALLCSSREAAKDFKYSRDLLQEVDEKLIQRRRSMRSGIRRY